MSLDKALVQRCYTTIMQHFIDYGHAPHYSQLAQMLGVSIEEARVHQAEAARIGVGCWLAHGTDNVESWAPFHGMATNYRFTINGEQKWFGQ